MFIFAFQLTKWARILWFFPTIKSSVSSEGIFPPITFPTRDALILFACKLCTTQKSTSLISWRFQQRVRVDFSSFHGLPVPRITNLMWGVCNNRTFDYSSLKSLQIIFKLLVTLKMFYIRTSCSGQTIPPTWFNR